MPKFFRDVSDDWVGQLQHLAYDEVLDCEAVVAQSFVALELALGGLDIPIAEISPEEGIDLMRKRLDLVIGETLFQVSCNLLQPTEDPMVVVIKEIGMDAANDRLEAGIVGLLP